jgi:hypothetical protein
MSAHRPSLVLALLFFVTAAAWATAADKPPALSAEDKKYLDGLMKEFLFDPKGAERVNVKTVVRTVWAASREVQAEGWLVPAKDGKPGRVHFTDGASIPAPDEKEMKKVDFVAACKARYTAPPKKKDDKDDPEDDEGFRKRFEQMRRTAVGAVTDGDLTLAAWLHRLGQEELSARALAAARKGEGDPRKRLRGALAWSAFAGMVHAYMVRADDEALAHGERLLRLYPEEAKDKEYNQTAKVVEELKRRQKKGTFGKTPPKEWPDGFDKWAAKKKASYLIDALEEVDARQWGQPGGIDLASDRRVQELIRQGDAVVPALIDAMEKDERLTRSVHFWRDFARSRTVLSVREAVLTALMSILRVRVFEPASTGDNFTARGEEGAKRMAERLRAYWKEYGKLPFDERMMKVLTDPKTKFEAKREAAENLAAYGDDKRIQTTITPTVIGDDSPPRLNPVIGKFNKPTAAEAILAAMDADLKAHDAKPREDLSDYDRRQIEGTYLSALVELKDQRIAPEFAKRAAAAKTVQARRQWAHAAHFLGEPRPFRAFAEDFRAGKIHLPAAQQDDVEELRRIVGALVNVGTPEAKRALDALADPKHPQHKPVARQVLTQRVRSFGDGPWFDHPYCLRILRKALDDTTATGATYVIEKDRLRRNEKGGYSSGGVPEFLADPASRRDKADERACDVAAKKLGELVVGLTNYHPLLKDSDKRLATYKETLDRFVGNYRRANWRESEILRLDHWTPKYIPSLRPLGRPATPADVKAAQALFSLDGKGMTADLQLPAVAVLKRDEKKERPPRALIVQAEVSANGQTTYGLIMRDKIVVVQGNEIASIKTFADLEKEEKEKAEQRKKKE